MDKLKILVVDDESRMRKLVRDFLVKHDFEVVEAQDGEEALNMFYSDKNIALILLDVDVYKRQRLFCWNIPEKRKGFVFLQRLTVVR